jgi:hypothetical protein
MSPLAEFGVPFFSAEESHHFLVLNILRLVNDGDDFPRSA